MDSPQNNVIHKRMMDTRLLGNLSWTLCNPSSSFSGAKYNYQGKEFVEWTKANNFYWKNVTCPECIAQRGKPLKKMRIS